jgi:hypothetical protein
MFVAGERSAREQHDGRPAQQRYMSEIAGLVRSLGAQGEVDGIRSRIGKQQCVAVRRRFRHDVRADEPARTRTVVRDDLLAPHFAQLLGEQARDDIIGSAGRVGYDQTHAALRIAGRIVRLGHCGGSQHYARGNRAPEHDLHVIP